MVAASVQHLIESLPKAELHVHIEGCIEVISRSEPLPERCQAKTGSVLSSTQCCTKCTSDMPRHCVQRQVLVQL